MAKVGTPTTMPTTPSKSPPITMATSTHSRYADGLAQIWADDIAVHLLDGNNQNQELESIKRVDEHQNQQTGDCADEGAKHRDDVGNANHDRDQRGKLDAKNIAADKKSARQ